MLCNTVSYYPHGIDEMIFFQDNNLEKADIINEYNKKILQEEFTAASEYINKQEGIYGYFADFFNAIENRIFHLQEHLLSKPAKEQPFIYTEDSEAEPDATENMLWI